MNYKDALILLQDTYCQPQSLCSVYSLKIFAPLCLPTNPTASLIQNAMSTHNIQTTSQQTQPIIPFCNYILDSRCSWTWIPLFPLFVLSYDESGRNHVLIVLLLCRPPSAQSGLFLWHCMLLCLAELHCFSFRVLTSRHIRFGFYWKFPQWHSRSDIPSAHCALGLLSTVNDCQGDFSRFCANTNIHNIQNILYCKVPKLLHNTKH